MTSTQPRTRRFLRYALFVALVSSLAAGKATAGGSSGCGGTPGASGTIKLKVGSGERIFFVRLPSGDDARTPRPVLLVFHGFTMNAHMMESLTDFSRAWPEAIVVYPQGLPRRFETMPVGPQPGWQVAAGELDNRDLAFFDAMFGWLRDNQCIDETRVYAAGYSNGAFFANLLGCERPGKIAGIAVAGGGMTCEPKEPCPVIFSHGTHDPLVSYQQAVAAAQGWSRRNGCRAAPKSGAPGCASGESCAAAPVVLCTVDGGHDYDGAFTREAVEFLKAQGPAKTKAAARR